MIGIWYYDPVSAKWLLFEETRQAGCIDRIAEIRAAGLTALTLKIARRRPTAAPRHA